MTSKAKKAAVSAQKKIDGKPKGIAKNRMTTKRWENFLQLTANGVKRELAIKGIKITRQTFDAWMVSHEDAVKQMREAETSWLRRRWPIEDIENILTYIAMGKTRKQAQELLFLDDTEMNSLYRLLLIDPVLREEYDLARKLQCESWADECIDIADDGSNDTYVVTSKSGLETVKTNYDVIQRSKERIIARHWNMKTFHRDRFGDQIKQDVNANVNVDHAARLTAARQRLEQAKKQRQELGKGADNTIGKIITDLPPKGSVTH